MNEIGQILSIITPCQCYPEMQAKMNRSIPSTPEQLAFEMEILQYFFLCKNSRVNKKPHVVRNTGLTRTPLYCMLRHSNRSRIVAGQELRGLSGAFRNFGGCSSGCRGHPRCKNIDGGAGGARKAWGQNNYRCGWGSKY